MLHLYQHLYSNKDLLKKRLTQLFLYACLYGIVRQQGKPVTLQEISHMAGHRMHLVARAFRIIHEKLGLWTLSAVDPIIYVERLVGRDGLPGHVPYRAFFDRCAFLMDLAQRNSLITGMRPMVMATAVASIALESLDGAFKPTEVAKLAQRASVPVSSVKRKRKEILDLCAEFAKQLPWVEDKGKKQGKKWIVQQIEDLQEFDYLEMLRPNELPPSLKRAASVREGRLAMVKTVRSEIDSGQSPSKEREGANHSPQGEVSCSWRHQWIRQMIEKGKSDDEILDLWNTSPSDHELSLEYSDLEEEISSYIRSDEEVRLLIAAFTKAPNKLG